MRTAGRWLLFVATVIAALALAVGAYQLASTSWDAVVEYRSPFVERAVPAAAAPGSSVASRTVFVIIDGLRLDASRQMGTLQNLRAYGVDATLTAPQPSLSYPNWTTLVSGAAPEVSGVVTNWHEGAAPAETLFDTAQRAGVKTLFVGPEDFDTLYGVSEKADMTFMRPWSGEYLTATYVDEVLKLAAAEQPRLIVVHLPDIDEAGHAHGGASPEYAEAVAKVDADLNRLVEGLQDGDTAFVVAADHGHIDTGGHGGWESDVVQVPGVFSGAGVAAIGRIEARQEDVASSVSLLAGLPVPRHSLGTPLAATAATASPQARQAASAQADEMARQYAIELGEDLPAEEQRYLADLANAAEPDPVTLVTAARDYRLDWDRSQRLTGIGTTLVLAALLTLLFIAVAAWRPFVAAGAGTVAYYAVYNLLFFVVHGYAWSLSAFNSEDLIGAWMNGRMIEAAVAGLVGVAVAGLVYPLLRSAPKGPRGTYLAGWLTLGPLVALVAQLTLAVQAGIYLWAWGLYPTWRMPDLMWAFKYDLDLVQMTALGAAVLLAPLVSYLVGRYHPMTRAPRTDSAAADQA